MFRPTPFSTGNRAICWERGVAKVNWDLKPITALPSKLPRNTLLWRCIMSRWAYKGKRDRHSRRLPSSLTMYWPKSSRALPVHRNRVSWSISSQIRARFSSTASCRRSVMGPR